MQRPAAAVSQLPSHGKRGGRDGSQLFTDPDLMGHFSMGPYACLEPELCFVLLADGAPRGYVCATQDVQAFHVGCEAAWFPPLRERYPLPAPRALSDAERELHGLIHEGIDLYDDAAAYPARLHIALLPEVQRRGGGRQLMSALVARLRTLGVPALHLEVTSEHGRDRLLPGPWLPPGRRVPASTGDGPPTQVIPARARPLGAGRPSRQARSRAHAIPPCPPDAQGAASQPSSCAQ